MEAVSSFFDNGCRIWGIFVQMKYCYLSTFHKRLDAV